MPANTTREAARKAVAELCARTDDGDSAAIAAIYHPNDETKRWGVRALVLQPCPANRETKITAVRKQHDVEIDVDYLPTLFCGGKNLGSNGIELSVADGSAMEAVAEELPWLVQRFNVDMVTIVIGMIREMHSRNSVESGFIGSDSLVDCLKAQERKAAANTAEKIAAIRGERAAVLAEQLDALAAELRRDGASTDGLTYDPVQYHLRFQRERLLVSLFGGESSGGPV